MNRDELFSYLQLVVTSCLVAISFSVNSVRYTCWLLWLPDKRGTYWYAAFSVYFLDTGRLCWSGNHFIITQGYMSCTLVWCTVQTLFSLYTLGEINVLGVLLKIPKYTSLKCGRNGRIYFCLTFLILRVRSLFVYYMWCLMTTSCYSSVWFISLPFIYRLFTIYLPFIYRLFTVYLPVISGDQFLKPTSSVTWRNIQSLQCRIGCIVNFRI